jgi:hypothetical protein
VLDPRGLEPVVVLAVGDGVALGSGDVPVDPVDPVAALEVCVVSSLTRAALALLSVELALSTLARSDDRSSRASTCPAWT